MKNGRVKTFAAGALFGAAAAYMLDPNRGNRRRALVHDQFASATNTFEETAGGLTVDARNRTRGMMHDVRARMTEGEVADRVLEDRVRAELGRHTSHPKSIHVMASQGTVTLSGRTLASDADEIIASVRSVRGVNDVHNRLEIHDTPGNIPDLQTHERHA